MKAVTIRERVWYRLRKPMSVYFWDAIANECVQEIVASKVSFPIRRHIDYTDTKWGIKAVQEEIIKNLIQ